MNIEDLRKPVAELRNRVTEIRTQLDALEEYPLRHPQRREYVVNVKRGNDAVDLEADIFPLLEAKQSRELSEGARQWLRDDMDLDEIWRVWLEIEREYVAGGLLTGMMYNSKEHWDGMREMLLAEIETGYPVIDILPTKQERLDLLAQWAVNDALALSHLDQIKRFEPSWCGRQGGYFYLKGAYQEIKDYEADIEERFTDIEEALDSMLQAEGEARSNAEQFYDNRMDELYVFVQEYEQIASAVLWALDLVDRYNKVLDFSAEVLMRAEDGLEEAKTQGVVIYQDEVDKLAAEKQAISERQRSVMTEAEKDRWDFDLHRFDDKDGDLMSLLLYPNGSPGTYGESEVFFVELPIEHIKEFQDFLQAKYEACLAEDEQRRQEAVEDQISMEGY